MSDEPTHKVIHPAAFVVDSETLRAVVREAVSDVLIRVGVDTAEAEELRKDMAYLRSWRENSDKVKEVGLVTAVKWLTLALIGLVLVGISVKLGIFKGP